MATVETRYFNSSKEEMIEKKKQILQSCVSEERSMSSSERSLVDSIDKELEKLEMKNRKEDDVKMTDLRKAKNGEELGQIEVREHHMGYNPDSQGSSFNGAKHVSMQNAVLDLMHKNAVILGHVNMQQVQGERKLPVAVNNNEKTAIVLENEAFSEKDYGVVFKSLECQKLGQMSVVSTETLQDSDVNVAQLIADQTSKDYARKVEELLLVGAEKGKAEGCLVCADANVVEVAGVDYNAFVDALYSLPKNARTKAVYITDNEGLKALRKMKDGNQRPLLQQSVDSIGQRGQDYLLGCPVVEVEATNLPDGVAGAFVDFDDAMFVGVGRNFNMVRDDSMKRQYDQVCFVSNMRFGCIIKDPKCIAIIKQEAIDSGDSEGSEGSEDSGEQEGNE